MQVAAPAWKWEWNLNTLVVLIGFASGFVALGYTLADIRQGRSANAHEIERLDKRVTAIEVAVRRVDTMELRLSNVEKQATDAASALRAVETTLNSLAADTRVMKEIMQRIEASQNGRTR